MIIREFYKAASLEDAYTTLIKRKGNCILGGCTFLRQTKKNITTAIDLSLCNLSYINEEDDSIKIGAYTNLRDMEISALLNKNFDNVFKEVLHHLVGVQLRNLITIGAHVASKFGFSDIIPTLLALNAKVRFYNAGVMTLDEYMNSAPIRDILVEIIIPKEGRRIKVQMARNSYTDYSLFCLSVSRRENDWIIAAGVLPLHARLAYSTMSKLSKITLDTADFEELSKEISSEFVFASNFRCSGQYRKTLCEVFSKRALEELSNVN